jgi:hypothetical protein
MTVTATLISATGLDYVVVHFADYVVVHFGATTRSYLPALYLLHSIYAFASLVYGPVFGWREIWSLSDFQRNLGKFSDYSSILERKIYKLFSNCDNLTLQFQDVLRRLGSTFPYEGLGIVRRWTLLLHVQLVTYSLTHMQEKFVHEYELEYVDRQVQHAHRTTSRDSASRRVIERVRFTWTPDIHTKTEARNLCTITFTVIHLSYFFSSVVKHMCNPFCLTFTVSVFYVHGKEKLTPSPQGARFLFKTFKWGKSSSRKLRKNILDSGHLVSFLNVINSVQHLTTNYESIHLRFSW